MTVGLLVCGAALLIVGVRCWLRATPVEGRPGRLARRVWTPLLVAIVVSVPLLAPETGGVGGGPVGWSVGLAVPLVVLLAVPTLLLPAVFGRRADPWDAEEPLVLVWPAVGVLLLLVAVAGRLPESGMLVLFSLGAVLLWVESIPRRGEQWGGPGIQWLAMALVGSAMLASGLWAFDPSWSTLIAAAVAAGVVVELTRHHGPRAGVSTAMWTAAVVALLAPGMLGFGALVDMLQGRSLPVTVTGEPYVGPLMLLSIPAVGLLACCGLLAGVGRWSGMGRLAGVLAVLMLLLGLLVAVVPVPIAVCLSL